MTDQNLVLLTGRLVSAAERTVGQSGRTLTELRVAVQRASRKGEAEETVLPITVWANDVGAAVRALPTGTALTVVGRLQSREWNNKIFIEVVSEHVRIDVTAAPRASQRELGIETPVTSARPSRERPRNPMAAAEDEGDTTPY